MAWNAAHLINGITAHPSWITAANSFKFLGFFNLMYLSTSYYNIRFKSGDYDGHFKTLIFFWAKNFFARLLVCFGSLSAWKVSSTLISSQMGEKRGEINIHVLIHNTFYAMNRTCSWPHHCTPHHHRITSSFDCRFGASLSKFFTRTSSNIHHQIQDDWTSIHQWKWS